MNIVTIKMVTMHILTYAVLDYIDNLPVLFVIHLFKIHDNYICLPTYLLPNIIYSFVLSLVNSKKSVRIQQFTGNSDRLPESCHVTFQFRFNSELGEIQTLHFQKVQTPYGCGP